MKDNKKTVIIEGIEVKLSYNKKLKCVDIASFKLGNITGNIRGIVKGDIEEVDGDIKTNIFGDVKGFILGKVFGKIKNSK